ncbi:bifunctional glycosyltransferase family 2 protein/CDP-glycerol:glycerophosphate glycerophosphotransferase [Streptomyces sp. NPDC050560]|uniref:bifunctional glycosyltransferase family 2 protein/CDP-glycerol:glycerophosphate glycerophosphotransferase n=1 Tax=Streptomyces sp. NPDC050560 TaxID=3365630 RepID=UPI00378E0E36
MPVLPRKDPSAAPRFSVVVPGHGVLGRYADALASVLAQSDGFGGVEVVPVSGGPEAPETAVALRAAARDGRVRPPVFSPVSEGLGGARNTGAAAAVGDYLLFLDGDDTLAPGALAAVGARLDAVGDVDVLFTGHQRVHWWRGPVIGEPVAEALAGVLDTSPGGPHSGAFPPAAAPRLTGAELPAWSAVHRRRFLFDRGLFFPPGLYTDLPWGVLELLAAERIAVLHAVCVRHLLRRQGSRLREPGPGHFDLLDQVDLALGRARRAGVPVERSEALFGRLTGHLLRVASAPGLLPEGSGAEFFERAQELYRCHRPAGYTPPPGALGVQHRLLAAGAYSAFRALRDTHRGAVRAAGRVLGRARRVKRAVRRRYPAGYAAALRLPVDENLAVYCAYWGRGYACNPAAIHAAAARLAPHIRSVFLVTEEAAERMPEGVDHAVLGSPEAWRVLARAKYLVNNANFPDAVVKRPGTVHLQTQHGTPLKTMGVEQAAYPVVAAHSGGFGRLLARVDRWDYNLSSNRHSTRVWEREFPASYEMLEYGYPRNDVYTTAGAAEVARARRALGVPEGRTALLYAPTHRDYRTGFDAQLDLEAFCEAAGEEFVVLLRAHYFYAENDSGARAGAVPRGARAAGGPRVIDVTRHGCAEDVCLAADGLITDYSSIMFDYANLDRPIVVFADDWDVYRETRGVTFDLMECPPGPVARTQEELAALFRDGRWADEGARRARAAFRERFCGFDDGRAAERVVRRVLLGEPPEALPPVVPLGERVPAPAARPVGHGPGGAGPAASVREGS